MDIAHDQTEFCKVCKKTFPSWDLYLLHKLQDDIHICCLVCGRDFRSEDGRNRHHTQEHAAKQDLSCAGCGMRFSTVGGYIHHIELHQCPVIHKLEFDRLRAAKELWHKQNALNNEMRNQVPTFRTQTRLESIQNSTSQCTTTSPKAPISLQHGQMWVTVAASSPVSQPNFDIDDGQPLIFHDPPHKDPSWETWGDDDDDAISDPRLQLSDFSPLKIQNLPPVMSTPSTLISNVVPRSPLAALDLGRTPASPEVTAIHLALNEDSVDWAINTNLLPNAPSAVKPPPEILKTMSQDPINHSDFDRRHPSHPDFNTRNYWNTITKKYRCPFSGCRKLQSTANGLILHLLSPAHMDERLRCPACLRQFGSATALVQHAESQARSCNIRESAEYRQAVDQITGGLVDTAGRHYDNTVKYVGSNFKTSVSGEGVGEANRVYWVEEVAKQEKEAAEMTATTKW